MTYMTYQRYLQDLPCDSSLHEAGFRVMLGIEIEIPFRSMLAGTKKIFLYMTPAYTATSFSYSARVVAHKSLQPFRLALVEGTGQYQCRAHLRRGLDECRAHLRRRLDE